MGIHFVEAFLFQQVSVIKKKGGGGSGWVETDDSHIVYKVFSRILKYVQNY